MSWETPKTDWNTNPKNPLAADFNRIENNIQFLKTDVETKKGLIVDAMKTVGLDSYLNDTYQQLSSKITASYQGTKIISPSAINQPISKGFHSGDGYVKAVPVPTEKVLEGTTIAGQTGTMLNRGVPIITPNTTDQALLGYYGGGIVKGDVDLIPSNIRAGTNIFDVVGTLIPKQIATGTLIPTLRDTGIHYVCDVTVTGLTFRPKTIILYGYYSSSIGTYAYTEEIAEIANGGHRNASWEGDTPSQFTEERSAVENKVTVTITNNSFTVKTLNFSGFSSGCNWVAIG